jgi:acyl carrier protein
VNEHEVADSVEKFVRTEFSVSPADSRFDRSVDLFEDGYIDSVGVVELLEFLRHRFEVDVPEEDLFSSEFSSIEGIARIVVRLLARGSATA